MRIILSFLATALLLGASVATGAQAQINEQFNSTISCYLVKLIDKNTPEAIETGLILTQEKVSVTAVVGNTITYKKEGQKLAMYIIVSDGMYCHLHVAGS